jgi:hypothetical protein
MDLVQILLPLSDNSGRQFPKAVYDALSSDLTRRFGGVTMYTRSPAEGRWRDDETQTMDDIIVVEVMVDGLDKAWWATLRAQLEHDLKQSSIVIRASTIEVLGD